jgi:hypothetical protein
MWAFHVEQCDACTLLGHSGQDQLAKVRPRSEPENSAGALGKKILFISNVLHNTSHPLVYAKNSALQMFR